MGLMKKAVRRATPRSVRKAKSVVKHPVGTAARAATPRSLRNAKRKAFNVTHPLNTAENALLNAATPTRKRRQTATTRPLTTTPAAVATSSASSASKGADASGPPRKFAGWLAFFVWLGIELVRPTGIGGWWWIAVAFVGAALAYNADRIWKWAAGRSSTKVKAREASLVEPDAPPQVDRHSEQSQVDASPQGHKAEAVYPQRVTAAWLTREVPTMSPSSFQLLLNMLVKRGWTHEEIQERVLPLRTQ